MQISVSSALVNQAPKQGGEAISSSSEGSCDGACSFSDLLCAGNAGELNPMSENAVNTDIPMLNMLSVTPEQQADLSKWLASTSSDMEKQADLAKWIATQPNPDHAFQQLTLFAEQGLLPAELTQVMAQFYAQLPMNQRMSLSRTSSAPVSQSMNTDVTPLAQTQVQTSTHSSATFNNHHVAPQMQLMTQNIMPDVSLNEMQSLLNVTNGTAQSTSTPTVSGASSSNTTMPAPQFAVAVDISSPEWGRELVDQLRSRMQFSQDDMIKKAHIRLDPPELGRLDVTVKLEGDKASVVFSAAHPQLREALASNAERLRMDFEQNNLSLVDVSVSSGMSEHHGEASDMESQQLQIVQQNTSFDNTPHLMAMKTHSQFESII